MKLMISAALLAAMAPRAHADVFELRNLEDFETCMQLDELLVTEETADGRQSRFLSEVEIQQRCIASATRLLATAKKKDVIMPFIDATKRLSAPVNALPLIDLAVGVSLSSCNNSEIYDALAAALDLPSGTGTYLARAKPIVVRCLKDKTFQKDFTEELGSHDKNLAAHTCDVLLEQKLVKSCKGSKP
jgi:hypothetical protein